MFQPLILLIALSSSQSCPDFETDFSLLSYTSQNPSSLPSCATQALSKNWFTTLHSLIESSIFSPSPFSLELKSSVSEKKKIIETLISKASNWGKLTTIPAAFQWAQSPNTTYLEIKYSHRMDAPGCSNVNDLKVKIEEDHFLFSGTCLRSNQKVKFLVEFETWDEVNTELSSFHEGNTGKLTVVLRKKKDAAWELPMKGKKSQNLQIWWEIKEKFKKSMKKLTGEFDEDDQPEDEFDDLLNNPNVVIENSYVNGKYVDNRKERGVTS